MTQIKFGKLKDFKKRADFDVKNADKINILFATYCDTVNDSVQNVSAFARSVKKQIADELWQEHLDNSKRAKENRAKKAKGKQQEDKSDQKGNNKKSDHSDDDNGQQDLFDHK